MSLDTAAPRELSPHQGEAFGECSCSSAGAEGTSSLQQQEPLPCRKVKAAGMMESGNSNK